MRSTLQRRREPLLLPFALSALGHASLLVSFFVISFLLRFCGDSKPVLDPLDSIEIAVVQLPKSERALPDRPTRAPRPAGKPAPKPAPAPTTPQRSDLAIRTPEAEPSAGVDDAQLEEALRQLEEQERLAQMEAALGALDQMAGSPEGDEVPGATTGSASPLADPEYSRYIAAIQKIFTERFQPLQAVRDANPGIRCVIHVEVDATGKVTRFTVTQPSGIEAFDAAARRAVEAVPSIPLPPPAYRDRLAQGYDIVFD